MTKEELVKIIEDNFTDEYGDINISGLQFNTNVFIRRMKVDGDLYQENLKVKGEIYN